MGRSHLSPKELEFKKRTFTLIILHSTINIPYNILQNYYMNWFKAIISQSIKIL